ncbi:MAG: 4Fe-4S binding protein [Candidatus Omnitrophota bacterium]
MIKHFVSSIQHLRGKKYWNLFVLGPLFIYPFTFCPFRLPYVYCFICPLKCIWYRLRGIVLVFAVGLNIKNNLFCEHLCPWGAIQRLFFRITPKSINLPGILRYLKYVSLILFIFIIAATKNAEVLSYNFLGAPLSRIVLVKLRIFLWITFLSSAVMSIVIYRPFCRYFCPVAALNKIVYFLTRCGAANNDV